jgi:hypothetical protein
LHIYLDLVAVIIKSKISNTKRSRIKMKIKNKKFGIGTIALILWVFGFFFSFSFKEFCLGDYIINGIGLKAWSGGDTGTHYTVYYSLVFFIPSFIIGLKHKGNFGSKLGRRLSAVMTTFILFSLLLIQ